MTGMGKNNEQIIYFLKNFDVENSIKIYDESGILLFDGKIGDVPQRISNMMSVIRGTVVNEGRFLSIKVKKC